MKLTILTQYYPPEVGAPQTRLSHLASVFVGAGHKVTVLTAMPNYPTGRIHPGYGGFLRREWRDGIRVLRTFVYPSRSASLVPRLLSYFSFVFSSALLGIFLLPSSDYLLVESPPLFLGLSALWLSRLKRARLIFNVSDLWPASALQLGVISDRGVAHRLGERLESLCYRRSWLVSCQSSGILRDIKKRFPTQSTFLLSNGADTSRFGLHHKTEQARRHLGVQDEFVVLYAGLHGLAQGLSRVIDAADKLREEKGYRFVFIGDGPEKGKLIHKSRDLGLGNVTFLDPVPSKEIPPLLASADLILVSLGMNIPGAVPSKLYEAMSSERAVVLIAEGEAAEIVRRFEAGLVVSPGDVPSLVSAIQWVRENPQHAAQLAARARDASLRHFDRTAIAEPFLRYLESSVPAEQPEKESIEVGAPL
jgi:colanic acid biosynthesis glycosyl transferase WcaI